MGCVRFFRVKFWPFSSGCQRPIIALRVLLIFFLVKQKFTKNLMIGLKKNYLVCWHFMRLIFKSDPLPQPCHILGLRISFSYLFFFYLWLRIPSLVLRIKANHIIFRGDYEIKPHISHPICLN